jgi:hypothetical protein
LLLPLEMLDKTSIRADMHDEEICDDIFDVDKRLERRAILELQTYDAVEVICERAEQFRGTG